MDLWIGNKKYSSWSMRAWLVCRHFDIEFTEHLVQLDGLADGIFKQTIQSMNPVGKVAILVIDDFSIWDSFAICEFLAEQFPQKLLWPQDTLERARARSLCAEMHSGFSALRSYCPMNIHADLKELGQQLWQQHADLRNDLQRVEQIWELHEQTGDFLFGKFSIADAFFAPVVMRVISYGLPTNQKSQAYMNKIIHVPAIAQWIAEAKLELTSI